MKILLPVVSFNYLTGSEMYIYELARELIRRGHEVVVASNLVAGAMAGPAACAGIKAYRFGHPETLRQDFDIIHSSEPDPTRWALKAHPTTPMICTIHSQYPCEQPIIDSRILHYICIRPEVQKKLILVDKIPEESTSVIYNPVDLSRYKVELEAPRSVKRVLFCGTMDRLRRDSIFDLITRSEREGFELWLLGLKAGNYTGYIETLPANVKWYDQTWHTEDYIHQCDETAGILLGRTTIEGWACGKPGWIYDIDLQGNVRSKALHQPPEDMYKFDSHEVVTQIEQLYLRYRHP